MANKTSQHILNTATNLLGFCLIIVSSMHFTNKSENSLVDEFTSIIALLLAVSCILSFISIRTENEEKEIWFEKIADNFFFVSLLGIFAIIVFIIVNYWNT